MSSGCRACRSCDSYANANTNYDATALKRHAHTPIPAALARARRRRIGAIGERNPHRRVVALAEPCGATTTAGSTTTMAKPLAHLVLADGFAVCASASQYNISKIKLPISMIVVTPAWSAETPKCFIVKLRRSRAAQSMK